MGHGRDGITRYLCPEKVMERVDLHFGLSQSLGRKAEEKEVCSNTKT